MGILRLVPLRLLGLIDIGVSKLLSFEKKTKNKFGCCFDNKLECDKNILVCVYATLFYLWKIMYLQLVYNYSNLYVQYYDLDPVKWMNEIKIEFCKIEIYHHEINLYIMRKSVLVVLSSFFHTNVILIVRKCLKVVMKKTGLAIDCSCLHTHYVCICCW